MAEEHELVKLNSFCAVLGNLPPWIVSHITLGGGGSNGGSKLIVVADVLVVIAAVSY